MRAKCFNAFVVVLCGAMLATEFPMLVASDVPDHFLESSHDSYKIAFMSGNFTASITRDMPRVVFLHARAVVSPTFVVSIPKVYLFNDTNDDGVFERSEALYTAYLDFNHISWNVSSAEFGNDTLAGEYAQVRMHGTASLLTGLGNETDIEPKIRDWANLTFSFRIYEREANFTTPFGEYSISGRTEMRVNFTIGVIKHLDVQGIAVEENLQGGGSTYMFLLRQANIPGRLVPISSRVPEEEIGTNFTHPFLQTRNPLQEVYFAKENGTVQAFSFFSSTPMNGTGPSAKAVPMNSSYYTTGSLMVLDQAFFITNRTDFLTQEMSLGIDEQGFTMTARGWFKENLPILMVVCGSIALVITLPLLVIMYRKYRRSEEQIVPLDSDK